MAGNKNPGFQEDEIYHKIQAIHDQKNKFDLAQKQNKKTIAKRKRKLSVHSKINQYKEDFTVHGLTKALTSDNRCEAIFWTIVLLGGIALSAYITQGNIRKFFRYEIYSQIREKTPNKNYFPSVTFCEFNELKRIMFSYCGEIISDEMNDSQSCQYGDIPKYTNASITTDNNTFWTNGKFVVLECDSLRGGPCLNEKYLKSSQLYNNSCITWNYNGTYYNLKSNLISFSFSFFQSKQSLNTPPIDIVAFPHEPGIDYVDLESNIHIGVWKETTMIFDKTVVKRLPHPYPLNCSFSKVGDILPGKYTRRKCIESNFFLEMYKECGDTSDFMRQFIPAVIKKQYKRNLSITQAASCIDEFEAVAEANCVFPCEYEDIGVTYSAKELVAPPRQHKTWFQVSLRHQQRYTYKILEEKELYTWQQMLSEIGGFIGLAIGASIISVFEIFTYLFLSAARIY